MLARMPDALRALADELAIRNVVAGLAQLADAGDLETYVNLYTADATWEMPGHVLHGHDQIRASAVRRRESGEAGPGTATRHLVSTTAVTLTGDEAVADSYWQFYRQTTANPVLVSMGHYRDALARIDGRWLVSRRDITNG
jgi:uncharacterized protein (TIGR02246 family)